MNRKLIALPLWMAVSGAAWGQARSADVLYTYRESTPVRAFRLGDECFVPIEALGYWGWTAERNGDVAQVSAEGNTISVPARTVNGQPSIAFRRAVQLLGANSEWVATTDTLQVYAPLKSLSYADGRLTAEAPLSVRVTGFVLSDPNRAVVDLTGARLPDKLDLPDNVKATQYRPNVVRLVVELPYVPTSPGATGTVTREVTLDLKRADLPISEPDAPVTIKPSDAPPRSAGIATPLRIALASETPGQTAITIPLGGRASGPATFVKRDPSTLEVTLPGLRGFLPEGFVSPTPAVSAFEASSRGYDTRLTLRLVRPMGAEIVSSSSEIRIVLVKPTVEDGKLAGKLVIVDPGHGGHDSGAKGGGVREKDLTLAVSKLLTDELTKQGATVIMTRKTDVFIPLLVRSDISNRNHADLFIAVHINSTGGSGSQSGTISFHHKGNPTGRSLAERIQTEMAKVNGLPNIGVWSDGRIYQSGFSVLRNTKQPAAVLLELGFINHPRDRGRMVTQDFQTKIAAAIVRGVRGFLGDAAQGDPLPTAPDFPTETPPL